MKHSRPWYTIINPNSGNNKGQADWHHISKLLSESGIEYTEVFSKEKLHSEELVTNAIKKNFRNIFVIGGDGTLNEVANGILKQEICNPSDITLAMIPVGTGNDWSRTFGIPNNYEGAIKAINKCDTSLQDVGIVKYFLSDAQLSRYFINVAGMGFDALVANKVNQDKEKNKTGKILYMKNLFVILIKSNYYHINISIDDIDYEEKIFSMSIGIGKYNGGGMMQLPNAVPDDGLFDITMIKDISKIDVIRNVKNLYDGTFISHPKVELHKSKSIKIKSEPMLELEVDGETLGHSPFEFEIIPKCLKVVVGEDFHGLLQE